MLPIFFIISLLISAGLLCFGYMQKEKATILIGGVILILLGVAATVNNVDYASGTNTTILTENQYQPYEYNETTDSNSTTTKTAYLLMNSSTTQTDTTTYSETAGIINNILGVILALIGLYFIIAAVTLI